MGMTARDTDQHSLWEFACLIEGHKRANGIENSAPSMDDDRLAELGIEGFNSQPSQE